MKQKTILDARVTILKRWFRVAIFFGSYPGSNFGFWRTDTDYIKGINYRPKIGRYSQRLTVMAHTKR